MLSRLQDGGFYSRGGEPHRAEEEPPECNAQPQGSQAESDGQVEYPPYFDVGQYQYEECRGYQEAQEKLLRQRSQEGIPENVGAVYIQDQIDGQGENDDNDDDNDNVSLCSVSSASESCKLPFPLPALHRCASVLDVGSDLAPDHQFLRDSRARPEEIHSSAAGSAEKAEDGPEVYDKYYNSDVPLLSRTPPPPVAWRHPSLDSSDLETPFSKVSTNSH